MKKLCKLFRIIAVGTIVGAGILGCASFGKPKSFVQATDGGDWSTIQIRDNLTYDMAYNEVLDVCAKRFEMDMISKDGGYGRTNWTYRWATDGKTTEKYRCRVLFKFSADRTRVDIKTEAQYGGDPNWIIGYDTQLLATMKQDISGVIGRTVL
jgi:hypothetical protein